MLLVFGVFSLVMICSRVVLLYLEGLSRVISLLFWMFRLMLFRVLKVLKFLLMLWILIFMVYFLLVLFFSWDMWDLFYCLSRRMISVISSNRLVMLKVVIWLYLL